MPATIVSGVPFLSKVISEVTERYHDTSRVDRAAGVIRGVLVLKAGRSGNGYEYTSEAIRNAVGLYEGAPVFWNHGRTPGVSRDLGDKIGWLSGCRLDGTAIRADLHLVRSNRRSEEVFESAERNPKHLGLSHVARVRWDGPGKQRAVEILAVRSVDVVDAPATTSTLFESRQPMSKEQWQRSAFGTVAEAEMGMMDPEEMLSPDEAAELQRKTRKKAVRPEVEALSKLIGQVATDSRLDDDQRKEKIARLQALIDELSELLADPAFATESRWRAFHGAVVAESLVDPRHQAAASYADFKRGLRIAPDSREPVGAPWTFAARQRRA